MSLTKEQATAVLNGEVVPAISASTDPVGLTKEQALAAMGSANYSYGWGQGEQVNPDDFDFNLKAGNFDNYLYRAQDQPWGAQLRNSVGRILPNAALEIMGGIGSIFDYEDYWNQDTEVGNSLVRAANAGKEAVNEFMPIYRENPGAPLDIGDSAWWFENGSGIASSAVAYVAMGLGTGALLSKGAQALQWVAKAGGMVKTAAGIGKAANIVVPGLSNLALNQAEGMLTAVEIYDETLKRGISQGLSQEEAKKTASSAASHSINVNRANIIFNATSVAAITKGVRSGVTKQILKKQAMGRAIALESAQEYAEEVVNLYAEKEGRRQADFDLLGKYYEDKPTNWGERLTNTVFSLEGLEAGILGAVGGAAQTGFTHLGRNVAINGRSKNAELNERIQQQQSFITGLDGVLKSQGTKNFTTNAAALDELKKSVASRDNLLNLADEYTKRGEEVPSKLATQILITGDAILLDQSLANFQQGTTEYLEGWYKDVQKASIDEATSMGYTGEQLNENSPVYYSKIAERALTKIKEFEKIYNQHYSYSGLGSIMANRVATEASVESIKVANTELAILKTEADIFNETLPLYGNDNRVLVEDFNRVSKTGSSKVKRYVTQAKKKRGLKPYLEALERQEDIIKEIKNLEKEYKKFISLEHQNNLKSLEKDIEDKKIAEEEKKVIASKEAKDLAEVQDDTDDQIEATNDSEAPVNNTEIDVESTQENIQPEVEGIQGYVGPENEVTSEVAEEEQAIRELQNELQGEIQKELQEENISTTEAREETAKENSEYIEDIQESKDIGEGPSFDQKDSEAVKSNIVSIKEKIADENTVSSKASSIAYLAEDILGGLNEDIDPLVFDYDKVNVGTPVTLRIDDSYTGDIYYNGEKMPWEGVRPSLNEEQLLEKTPIAIMVGDKKIGFVHDTEWFTEENKGKEITLEEEQAKNRAIRQAIFDKGEVKTTITFRGNGIIPTIEGTKAVAENLPGVKIAVIKDNVLSDYKELNILNRDTISNGDRIKDGYTLALVPVNKDNTGEDEYIAYPLLRQKLNPQAKSSIVKSVTILMKSLYYTESITPEETKIAEDIVELIGADIRTPDGLQDYMKLFTYNTYNTKTNNLSEFMLTQNENKYAINITKEGSAGVSFGKGGKQITKTTKNVIIPAMFKSNPNTYLEGLENVVEHLYAHISDDLLNSKITIPVISEDNKVSTLFTGNYTDYAVTYNLHTDAIAHEIGTEEEPKSVFTIQSVISYDESFANYIPEVTQSTTVEATERTNIDKDTLAKETKEKASTDEIKAPKGLEFMDDFDFSALKDKNKNIEGDELFAAYEGNITSDYIVSGLPANMQELLIDNIIFNVVDTIENDELVLQKINEAVQFLTEKKFPEIKEEAWKLKELVRLRLQTLTNTVIQSEDKSENSTESNDEIRSVEEKDKAWGIDLLTINPKNNLSSRLKQLFSSTPLVYKETGVPVKTKEGLTVYAGFDDTYEIVMSALTTNFTRDNAAPKTFSAMMDTLMQLGDIYTFLPSIVEKLKKVPRQLKNEFMVNADKHYTHMAHIKKGFSEKTGFYYNVVDDNANSRTSVISQLWRNNNLQVAKISNDLLAKKEVVDELKAEFDKWVTEDKQFEDEKIFKWLSDMGITINKETLEAFKEEDIEGVSYVNHFLTPKGIFKNIREALDKIEDGDELLEAELYKMDAFNRLAREEASNNSMYVASSFRSGVSNVFAYQEQKWATKRTSDIKYNKEKLTKLAKNPITKNISWLKKLGKLDSVTDKFIIDKESRFFKNFSFGYVGLGALQDADSFSATKKKLSELDSTAHEEVKKGLFENKFTVDKFGSRIVRFFFPTMSDNSNMFTLKTEAFNVSYSIDGKLDKDIVDSLFDTILRPEINRMVNLTEGKENIANSVIINGKQEMISYDQGAMMFYSVPELNNIPEIWNGEGNTRRLNLKVGRKGIEGDSVIQAIKEGFEKHLDSLVIDQLKDWEDLDLYNSDTHTFSADNKYVSYLEGKVHGELNSKERNFNKAKLAAADYTLNYLAANANFQVLYAGDAAQYYIGNPIFKEDIKTVEGEFKKKDKIPVTHSEYYPTIVKNTFSNVGKRLALLAGPRRSPLAIKGKKTYRQGFLKDKIGESLGIEYIDEIFQDNTEARKAYRNILTTDAVELITLEEKLNNLYGDGKIGNKDYDRLLGIYNNNKDFSPADLAKLQVFQADKPLYVGGAIEPTALVERQLYIKSASITLLPQFTRNLEIDKLRVLMENKNNPIDRVAFSSAVKVGNVKNPLNIWNEDGTILDNLEFASDQVLTLNRDEYGIQQDIPYKQSDTIKRSVQASKLAFVNLLDRDILVEGEKIKGRELHKDFLNSWETLYKISKEEFFDELGVDVTKDVWKPDTKKLSEYIKKEAELRNLSLQDLEGLSLREDGTFELPLWINGANKQFESLLNSLIINRVLNQNMPGRSYVLASEEGFQTQAKAIEDIEDIEKFGILYTEHWNEKTLLPSLKKEGTITNNQVFIPWPFKGVPMQNYMKEGKLDMSKIDNDLLTMYGIRIPTQGPNSTANIEIAGFLPEVMGDIIIAPRDFITQMGSDFDVDKLYNYVYNHIITDNGDIRRVEEKYLNPKKLQQRLDKAKKDLFTIKLLDLKGDKQREKTLLNIEISQIEKLLAPNALIKIQAQDNITKIHRLLNADPSDFVQRQLRAPLGEGKLKEYANTIENSREKDTLFSPYSPSYQRNKFKNAASGKEAISVFAISNTFNASVQVVENPIKIQNKGKDLYVRFGEQRSEGILNRLKTLDKKETFYISDNISNYMSISVDNEKIQALHNLNINNVTYGVVNLLTQLGFTAEVTSSFLGQNIIFELVNKVEKFQSKGESVITALNKAFKELEESSDYKEDVFETMDEGSKKEVLKKYMDAGSNFLFEVLKKGKDHPDYKITQKAILRKFKFLHKKALSLQTLQRIVNIDSSGIGQNLLESKVKEEAIVRTLSETDIIGSSLLLGETAYVPTEGYHQFGDFFFKPTSLAGFAALYGVIPNNRLWNQPAYFPYTDIAINDTINTIIDNSNIKEFDEYKNASIEARIFNGIKSYLISDLSSLGFIDNSLQKDSGRLARYNLLANEGVLQSLIATHRESKFFRDNPFLNKLSIRKRKAGTPASINFTSKDEDKATKNSTYGALVKLLNSTEVLPERMQINNAKIKIITEQDLARALIVSQYAAGGIQKYTQFLRYIPLDYLKKIGFNEKIRNLDFATLLNEGRGENKFQLPYVAIQFLQHNSYLLNSPEVELNEFLTKDAEKEEDITKFSLPLPKNKEGKEDSTLLYSMLKLKGRDKNHIFLYGGNEYTRLDNLGGIDFNEYQKGEITRSVIHENIARNTDGTPVSYYDQVAANTSEKPLIIKAKQLNHATLDHKYAFDETEPTISKTLMAIVNGGSAIHKALAEDYLKVFKDGDYKLIIDRNLPSKGRHIKGEKTLLINPDNLTGDEDYTKTFLHEVTHMLTVEVLENPATDQQKAAKASLTRLLNSYRKTLKSGEWQALKKKIEIAQEKGIRPKLSKTEIIKVYPATSLKEFVAGFMTDVQVQQHLNKVNFNSEVTYGQEYEKRLLRILNSVEGFELSSTSAKAIREVIALLDYKNDIELNPLVLAKMENSTSINIDNVSKVRKKEFIHTTEDVGIRNAIAQAEADFLESDIENRIDSAIEQAEDRIAPIDEANLPVDPTTFNDLPIFQETNLNKINFSFKAINILFSEKAKQVFEKGKKNNWDLNKILVELQIPKIQKQIILDKNLSDREDIITSFLADTSFVIEINTSTIEDTGFSIEDNQFEPDYDEEGNMIPSSIAEIPTDYYSDLTVPGGTNYTENEISTPAIIPNIKGHAQFSTDNGIGWFRSDEQEKNNRITVSDTKDIPIESFQVGELRYSRYNKKTNSWIAENLSGTPITISKEETIIAYNNLYLNKVGTGIRRILEVQSDLFQKSRDKKNLLSPYSITHQEQKGKSVDEVINNQIKSSSNQFLQLLNKRGNWVSFFIKSIVQDSVKKGYKKVLFPTGKTVAKIEGHQTIIEELENIDKQIKIFKNSVGKKIEVMSAPEGVEIYENTTQRDIDKKVKELENKKDNLKSQGIEKLKPIEAFYTNRVTNILNKLYTVVESTDKYGNTWNEVDLNQKGIEESFEDLPVETKEEVKVDLENPTIKNKQAILKALQKKKARDKKRMHDVTDPKLGVYYENRIFRTKDKIAEIEQEISSIKGISTYETTLETAKKDLAYVDTVVNSNISLITSEDMEIADSIIKLWKNFRKEDFTKKIYGTIETKEDFDSIEIQARELEDKLHNIAIEKTKTFIKRELPKTTSEDIKKLMAISDDMGVGYSYVLDLSRVDNVIAQAMARSILTTNDHIIEEVAKIADELDPILQNVEKALKKLGLTFDVYKQLDEKGRETGKIVMPYSQKFWDVLENNNRKAFSPKATKKDKEDYKEWQKLTQIVVDPSKLEDESHINKIIKEVGEENIEHIKKQALKRQEYYLEALEREEIRIADNPDLTIEEKKNSLRIWIDNTKFKYTISVPRKINTRGESTGFYDSRFETIQNNPDLKAFHNYTIDLLSTLGTYSTFKKESINSIPLMQKEFWEAAKGKDTQGIFNLMADAMRKGLRGKGAQQDYVTEVTSGSRTLSNNFNEFAKRQLADRLTVKELQYTQSTKKEPTKQQIKEWKADIIDEISKESSFDLGKILKTYAATAVAYKHKAQVETPLRIAEKLLKKVKVAERSSSGAILNNLVNKGVDQEGLTNINKMVTSTLDYWFGVKRPEKIRKSGEIKYTSEEKKIKVKLDEIISTTEKNLDNLKTDLKEGSITEETYKVSKSKEQITLETAQEQLNKIGGKPSLNKKFLAIIKLRQVLGMAWNAIAGVNNLGFGFIANIREGAGGEFYSAGKFMTSFGSVLKGTLFGIKTKEGKKQSILMKRWGLLQKSSEETFKRKTTLNKFLNFISFYKIQDTTEYLNQTPIMDVMMKTTSVLDSEGKPIIINGTTMNFYNAYDYDGNWRVDLLGKEVKYQRQKDDLRLLIGDLIARNHGNYNSDGRHLMVKDTTGGKALSQFRGWMFEGIGGRFREGYEDRIVGVTKKGAYETVFEDWRRASKALVSKKAWGELSTVDQANMRKIFVDVGMWLSFFGFVAMLKGAIEDEEDEDKLAVLHLLINISLRMQTDIAFYINPIEAERLTQSTIPAASIISESTALVNAMYKYIMDEDEIVYGVYAGESNLLHKVSSVTPLLRPILQIHKTAAKPFR